jgi:hypothetical protein
MSEGLKLVLTWLGYFAGAMFIVFLIAATVFGIFQKHGRGKEKNVAKQKRLSMKLGQQLEVEYAIVPEDKDFASGITIHRVFAYNGAVRVDVTPLLLEHADDLLEKITNRCLEAEGLANSIPF